MSEYIVNYIYLLQEREFIKTNENIYKIGMSKKQNHKRFNQYPKGSILLFQMICDDCVFIEKQILKLFKEEFIQRKDIGTEYFEGIYNDMIDIIYSTIKNEKEITHNEITDNEITDNDKEIQNQEVINEIQIIYNKENVNITEKLHQENINDNKLKKTTLYVSMNNKCNSNQKCTGIKLNEEINNNEKYNCELCDYISSRKNNYNRHLLSLRHKDNMSKNNNKFVCSTCNFECNKKSSYKIHMITKKHIQNMKEQEEAQEKNKNVIYAEAFKNEVISTLMTKINSALEENNKNIWDNKQNK